MQEYKSEEGFVTFGPKLKYIIITEIYKVLRFTLDVKLSLCITPSESLYI